MQLNKVLIKKLMDVVKDDPLLYTAFTSIVLDESQEAKLKVHIETIFNEYQPVLSEIVPTFNQYKGLFNQYKKRYANQVQKKHQQYVDKDYKIVGYAKNELAMLHQTLIELEEMMVRLPKSELPENKKSPEEKIGEYKIKIQEWVNSKTETKFIEYPLFSELEDADKLDFLLRDFKFTILDFLSKNDYKQFILEESDSFLFKSNFQMEHQIIGEDRTRYPIDNNSLLKINGIQFSVSQATKKENVRILYLQMDGENPNEIPALTYDDDKIYLYLLTFRNKDNFFTTKQIVCSLNELTLKVYPNTRRLAQNKIKVLKSLEKIRRFAFLYLEDGKKYDISFIHTIDTSELKETKDTILTVTIPDRIIRQLFINSKVTAIYEKDVKDLSGLHWGIAFFLQKLRVDIHNTKASNSMTIHYNEFHVSQSFPSNNSIKQNITLITSVLNYFKENKIMIEDFSFVGRICEIHFIPISDEEFEAMSNLVIGNDTDNLPLIENESNITIKRIEQSQYSTIAEIDEV